MKLQEKQREIEQLRELDSISRDAIRELSERLMQLEARFDKKQAIIDLAYVGPRENAMVESLLSWIRIG